MKKYFILTFLFLMTLVANAQTTLKETIQKEKPKTVEQLSEIIENFLTSESSLTELQKLMDESLKKDSTAIEPIKQVIPIKNDTTVNNSDSVNTYIKNNTGMNRPKSAKQKPFATQSKRTSKLSTEGNKPPVREKIEW